MGFVTIINTNSYRIPTKDISVPHAIVFVYQVEDNTT